MQGRTLVPLKGQRGLACEPFALLSFREGQGTDELEFEELENL